MPGRNFRELLERKWDEGKFLCVGLDTDLEKIPDSAQKDSARATMVVFNRAIVDATKDIVCTYKPNSAFYEARGDEGFAALRETTQYILDQAPDVPVILDAKRADIGSTNKGYVDSIFHYLQMDAVTVHPYLGSEALKPFLERKDKGIFVLCRTSNGGAGELQDLMTEGEPLYKQVAHLVGDMPILIPGVGAQGGDLEKAVRAGKDSRGKGMIVATSRSIIFASHSADFAEAARAKATELHGTIMKALV